MAEHVMGPSKTIWQINESGIAPVSLSGISPVIGSVCITNASIAVDVTVADYVSVTQSGNYIVTLGSQAITNVITGSVVQKTSPWIVLGSQAITNVLTGSVIQSTSPWIVLGSQAITNTITGSVIQSTNPWIVLGSVLVTGTVGTGSVLVTNTSGNCVRVSEKYVSGKPRMSSTPYTYDIAEGNVANHTVWTKTGYNPNVGTTEEDLWSYSIGKINYPASAGSILIKSTNAADTSGNGVGIRAVYINYLDSNYIPKKVDIYLNGTSDVWTSVSDIFRINNFRAFEVGASGNAIGNIYCGSPTVYSYITAGFTRARNSAYTVPSGQNLFVTSIAFSAAGGKDVRMYTRATYDNGTGSMLTPGLFFMPYTEAVLQDSALNRPLDPPTKLPQKTDLKVSAISTVGAAIAEVAMRGWLEDA